MHLSDVSLFHSDRGTEFNNHLLDNCFDTFNIEHFLNHKGYSYDKVVAEAMYKTIKTSVQKERDLQAGTIATMFCSL